MSIMEENRVPTGSDRANLQQALSLSGYRRLRLEDTLEADYHRHRQMLAIANIRTHWRMVVLSITAIAAALFALGLVDAHLRDLVLMGTAVVLLGIGLVVMAATLERLNGAIDAQIGLAAFVGLLGMHIGVLVAPETGGLHAIAEYGVIFITLAVFTISGLSFVQSLLVCVCTIAVTLLAASVSGAITAMAAGIHVPTMLAPVLKTLAPEWGHFSFYGLGSVLIAAMIGVSHELRERTVFLQERLLTLEKKELDQLSRELTLISREDALTHLANRRHFDEVFAREWSASLREGTLMNLIFIDVDYFKRYNDHYGHQAGDDCLARVAAVLATQTKRGADFVARYGGEEFVAFFPRTNTAGLIAIAERMIEAVDELAIPHKTSDVAGHVTISVGIAVINPAPGMKAEELLHAADAALYRAKKAGRHGYVASWVS